MRRVNFTKSFWVSHREIRWRNRYNKLGF